jgi:multiple sugar transport system substrate-binding protein
MSCKPKTDEKVLHEMKRIALALLICLTCASSAMGVTIEWWQFWTDSDIKPVIESMVSEFEQANPDIEVELRDLTWANGHEKIVISLASGSGPDVLELGSDWIAQFADKNQLADITEYIVDDSSEFQGWGMATYQDKVYAKPWILGTRVMFANRGLLDRAGHEEDFVPINFPDLVSSTQKVDALGDDIYGWGSNAPEKHRLYKKFLPFFWSYGGKIYSDDGKYVLLAAMPGIEGLRKYKWLHEHVGYVANQRGLEDAFLDGKIGYVISGDWLLKRIKKENRDIELTSMLIPGPKFPGLSFMGGEFLAINAASENKEAAMKLIDYITAPENQVRFCRAAQAANPSSLTAQEDEYFTSNIHFQTFIKQIKLAKHPPVDPNWVMIEAAIEEAVEEALFGSGLVAEPLRKAALKVRQLKAE